MRLGHQNTGEVVEVGSHVERIKKGDLFSVPFNVACGTCRNCKERHTDVCLNANDELNKQGRMALSFPKAWVKSPAFMAGQCPVMRYNRELMMGILRDRMPYLTNLLQTEVITLDDAVTAYKVFHDGSPKKYVIDAHNTTKLAVATK